MKNIPVFTTEYGVASLLLREIPYKKTAYVRIQTVTDGKMEQLARECAVFCRMAGAEQIFFTGMEPDPFLREAWRLLTLERENSAAGTSLQLCKVTEENVGQYKALYQARFSDVLHAVTCDSEEQRRVVSSGKAWLLMENDTVMGLGEVRDSEICTIAACHSGWGQRCMEALMTQISGAHVQVRVDDQNERAVRLYLRMGFRSIDAPEIWYELTDFR